MVLPATLYHCNVNKQAFLLVALQSLYGVFGIHCVPKNCHDLRCYGLSKAKDGPHQLFTGNNLIPIMNVSCDQISDGGGWVVMMRRVDGSLLFNRTWAEYRDGFGEHGGANTNLWMGMEQVFDLTVADHIQLRIEGSSFEGESVYLEADEFYVDGEDANYALHFARSTGYGADIDLDWNHHKGAQFATIDHYRNSYCIPRYTGGWWYKQCHNMYLTGVYRNSTQLNYRGMYMQHFNEAKTLKNCLMMFRKMTPPTHCYNPCLYGGTCVYDLPTNVSTCYCERMRCGPTCQVINPCVNTGACDYTPATNKTRCICPKTECGPICEFQCDNGGTCVYLPATHTHRCDCPPTHCGAMCEFGNPCENGAACEYSSTTKKNRCVCPSTRCGPTCEFHCNNGGTCEYSPTANIHRCVCPASQCGTTCEAKNPCVNGAACEYSLETKEAHCTCSSAYCGATCQKENPCKNNATCAYDKNTKEDSCVCAAGFSGATCTEIEGAVEKTVHSNVLPITLVFLFIIAGTIIAIFWYAKTQKKRQAAQKKNAEEEAETEAACQRLLAAETETGETNFLSGLFGY